MTQLSCYNFWHKSLFLFILLLIGCDTDNRSLSANSIIYCSEGAPETFNPQLATNSTTLDATSHQFYNRLVSFDSTNQKLTPSLAKSWTVSPDGKTITFQLRKKVGFHHTAYFSPSRFFNADDVLFSFNRILDPNHEYHYVSGGNYPYFERIKLSKLIENIEKVNDYTVKFTLKTASNTLLLNLSHDSSVILSQEYAQFLSQRNTPSQIDKLPIGTGPFLLKNYRVGSFIRYLPHTTYWGESSKIEQLVFDITPSNTGRLTKLLAGECDIVSDPIAHAKIKNRPDLILDSVTSYDIAYLGLNTKKSMLNNLLVRKAIAKSINKQTIIDTIYLGKSSIAHNLFPEHSLLYNKKDSRTEFSPTRAKELLVEAGYPNGGELELWVDSNENVYNPAPLSMAALIKEDLQKIGINISIISTLSSEEFTLGIQQGKHHMVLTGWSAEHSGPNNLFSPILGCSSQYDYTFWCHDEFSKLLTNTLKSNDIKKRKANYTKAMQLIKNEVPLIPLAHPIHYQARSKKVKGVSIKPIGGINFQGVNKI